MPLPHRLTRVVATVVAVAAATVPATAPAVAGPATPALPATTSSADDTPAAAVTWALSPAGADGPDGRVSLRHAVDPGGTVTDHVTLTNFSEAERTFVVYAGDGTIAASGDFDLAPREARAGDGAGAWLALGDVPGARRVDVGALELAVPPASHVTIPVTVAVPDDAAPGDHPAGLVAELAEGDATVQVAARVGVRLHLRVTGDVVARVAPDGVRARWVPSWNPFAPGEVHVVHDVVNEGHVRLGARATTSLAGPFGLAGTSTTVEHRELLPGGVVRTETVLPVWPLVRATGRVAVVPQVVGEDETPGDLATVTVPVAVWTPPWAQLLLVAVVVGLVLLGRWWRRRAVARFEARVAAAVDAATGPEGTGATATDPSATAPAGG